MELLIPCFHPDLPHSLGVDVMKCVSKSVAKNSLKSSSPVSDHSKVYIQLKQAGSTILNLPLN